MSRIIQTLNAVAPASASSAMFSGITPDALWPMSMTVLRAAFSRCARSRLALLVGGSTLGMSNTVVTPPAAAARVPLSMSSLCV